MVESYVIPGFSPFGNINRDDLNGSIKVAVECLLDYDPQQLRKFMGANAPYAGVGGDGGWDLEERRRLPNKPDAYSDWPEWAEYRAYVEPGESYDLDHPEGFYDKATFKKYLREGLRAYVFRWPEKRAEIEKLMSDLDIGSLDE